MREFRPPVRPSVLRLILGLLLPVLVLVPIGFLASRVLGYAQATYTVSGGALVVRSGDAFAGDRTARLDTITEARVVPLRGGRRTAGTALPGFCAGRFAYPELGDVWQVTTCPGQGVLVRTNDGDRPIIVSPPVPEAFLAAIHDGSPFAFTLPPPDRGPVLFILYLLLPLIVLSTLPIGALLILGPGRMRYLVGDGTFEVRTMFGTKRWPTAGAHAKAYTPSRLWRVAGVAAPGYYTGMFREAGQSTRVYATEVDRVVLFEGAQGAQGAQRVLVSPEDRVELLRALEAEGARVEKHAV